MALAKTAAMPPPGMDDSGPVAISPKKPGAAPDDSGGDDAGKMSPEEAHVVRADQHCKDCANYAAESGDCSKVSGTWDPEDACIREFKALGGDSEPDADDTGGASDSDADDMPAPGGPAQ